MSSELANSSDVHTSPSEPDFERKPGEPFKSPKVQVSPNVIIKQNAEVLGSSSSYITFKTRVFLSDVIDFCDTFLSADF